MAFPFSALPSDTTVCGEDIRPSVTKRRVAVRDREDRSVLFPKPCIPFRGFRDLPKFLCRAGFLCPVPADNRTAFSSFSRTAAFAVSGRFCCRSVAADRTFTPSFPFVYQSFEPVRYPANVVLRQIDSFHLGRVVARQRGTEASDRTSAR